LSLTAAEFAEPDGLASIIHGTLAHIKTFGYDSYDPVVPLKPPKKKTNESLTWGDQGDSQEFHGYYLQERQRTVNVVRKGNLERKKRPSYGLRTSKSMGSLQSFTPEQLSTMDNGKLAAVLESANLLKRRDLRRSKSGS